MVEQRTSYGGTVEQWNNDGGKGEQRWWTSEKIMVEKWNSRTVMVEQRW